MWIYSKCIRHQGGEKYNKLKRIKNVSKVHHVKYLYDKNKVQYQVWQYSGIGNGKKFQVSGKPVAPTYEEKKPFFHIGDTFGYVKSKSDENTPDIPCTKEACILRFPTYKKLENHLNCGRHKFEETTKTQLSKVTDNWVRRYQEGNTSQMHIVQPNSFSEDTTNQLKKGWAIPERTNRRLTVAQKTLLNNIYDRGELSGNKASAAKAEKELRKVLTPAEYLPVSTIKSYFSRRTVLKKKGKIKVAEKDDGGVGEDGDASGEEDDDCDDAEIDESDYDSGDDSEAEDTDDNKNEIERTKVTASISVAVSGVDINKDEWVAVGYPRCWYPGQFVQFDPEEEEI